MHGIDLHSAVAAALAVVILIDVSVLTILGQPVPEIISNLAFGVFGYYFGRARNGSARPSRPEA